jgi:hypothetical protein
MQAWIRTPPDDVLNCPLLWHIPTPQITCLSSRPHAFPQILGSSSKPFEFTVYVARVWVTIREARAFWNLISYKTGISEKFLFTFQGDEIFVRWEVPALRFVLFMGENGCVVPDQQTDSLLDHHFQGSHCQHFCDDAHQFQHVAISVYST